MRRYFIEKEAIKIDLVYLEDETLHHIRDVCRQHVGARFEVITEQNHAYFVEIIEESKKRSIARILEKRELPELPLPLITLVLSVPKFPVFEAVLEKMVELGVHDIRLAFSDFSFLRHESEAFERKWARWQKIVRGASQQSGRGRLLEIHNPEPLEKIVSIYKASERVHGLFMYEGNAELGAKGALQPLSRDAAALWLFVGSEGGYSDNEVQMFQEHGLPSVGLGDQVLRVETACVAAVSVLKYEFDLMR